METSRFPWFTHEKKFEVFPLIYVKREFFENYCAEHNQDALFATLTVYANFQPLSNHECQYTYLSDHSQPKEEPDHTDKSGKHFFAVAAPQVVRIQIHNGGHNTLDTYKLNVWRNKKNQWLQTPDEKYGKRL